MNVIFISLSMLCIFSNVFSDGYDQDDQSYYYEEDDMIEKKDLIMELIDDTNVILKENLYKEYRLYQLEEKKIQEANLWIAYYNLRESQRLMKVVLKDFEYKFGYLD